MTARPRRTTTLVGPNRIVLGAATAGLVALASVGTALLVLTGTSSVAPGAAPVPPLPRSTPFTRAPGVVVLPSDDAGRLTGDTPRRVPPHSRVFRTPAPAAVPPPVPVALAFTDVPPPVIPPVVVVPPPVDVVSPLPALHRAPELEAPDHPGRHLAKGHVKHEKAAKAAKHSKHAKHKKHLKRHGKRVGWAHSQHHGNR